MGGGHFVDVSRGVEAHGVARHGHGAVVAGCSGDAQVRKSDRSAVAGVDRERNVCRACSLCKGNALVQLTVKPVVFVEGAFPIVHNVEVANHERSARGRVEAFQLKSEGDPLVAVVVFEREGHLRVGEQAVDGVGKSQRGAADFEHDAARVWHRAEVLAQTADGKAEVESFALVGGREDGVLIEHDVRGRHGGSVRQHKAATDRLRGQIQRHDLAVHTGVHVANLGVVEHRLPTEGAKAWLVERPVNVAVVGDVHAHVVGVVTEPKVEPKFRDPAIEEVVRRIEVEAHQGLEPKHGLAELVPLPHDHGIREFCLWR